MHGYVARCPLVVLARFRLVVVLAAGCTAEVSSAAPPGGGDRGEVTPEAPARGFTVPPDSLAGQPVPLTVYYLRTVGRDRYLVPERHPVRLAVSDPEAAVRELLAGAPVYPGSARPFPSGCHLLGFARDGSRAVVNLSREAAQVAGGPKAARLAVQALVWTVTRAADVRRVLVKVEGRTAGEVDGRLLGDLWGPHASPAGLTRDERVPVAPIALVEPVPGARVHGGRGARKDAVLRLAGVRPARPSGALGPRGLRGQPGRRLGGLLGRAAGQGRRLSGPPGDSESRRCSTSPLATATSVLVTVRSASAPSAPRPAATPSSAAPPSSSTRTWRPSVSSRSR